MVDYNPAIPQPGDLISNSQGQILNNFFELNRQFGGVVPSTGGDHDGYNNGIGNGTGMHNQVTFRANQTAPSLTRNGTAGVSGLYSKLIPPITGVASLFFQNTTQDIQLTGAGSVASGSITIQGGLVLKWGSSAFSGTATALTITFPTAFPAAAFFSSATAVTSTGIAANVMGVSVTGTTQMIVNRAGGTGVVNNMTVLYFAIGN